VHVAVDDCSRVAYLEVHADEQAQTVAGFAGRSLAFFAGVGVSVERLMTDNGSGYRFRRFGEDWPALERPICAPAPIGPPPTAGPNGRI
jgi:hypothetical protein